MEGFFSDAEARVVKSLPTLIPLCDKCGLFKGCRTPKMPVTGKGERKILIVGDGPR